MFGDRLKDENQKQVRSPVSFVKEGENYQTSPISFIEHDINGETKFAILKTTENGKYMRGEMLFFKLNGVEVYTEATNIIFVDTKNNILWIKEYEKVLQGINPSDPESKEYVILYTDLGYDEAMNKDEFPLRWESVTGRSQAYDNIKLNAPIIDIDKSLVLVDTVPLKDSLTVRQFMDYLKNSNIIDDESFDINDYTGAEYI